MLKTLHCFLGRRHHLTLDVNNLVLLLHGGSRWVVFCNSTDVKEKGQSKVKCLTVTCVVPVLLAALGAPPGGGGD